MPKFTSTLTVPQYSSAPATARNGDVYYNTTSNLFYARINSVWVDINQSASTSQSGSVQLTDSISTTSSTLAATATAVKAAADIHGVILNRTTDLSINTSDTTSATAITWSGAVSQSSLYTYWSSGSTITIPVTGWYALSCHIMFGSGSAYSAALFVQVNTAVIGESEMQAEATTRRDTLGISTYAYLTAADTVVFRASSPTASKVVSGTGQRSRCQVLYLGSFV
jgi:hypothetical protein